MEEFNIYSKHLVRTYFAYHGKEVTEQANGTIALASKNLETVHDLNKAEISFVCFKVNALPGLLFWYAIRIQQRINIFMIFT